MAHQKSACIYPKDNDRYVCHGNEIINLRLVRHANDFHQKKNIFKPLMCHQVFGSSEQIFGYRKLKIDISYNAETFQTLLHISFDGRLQEELTSLGQFVEADDFLIKLIPWLPKDFFTDKTKFIRCLLEKNNCNPFGEEIMPLLHDMGIRKDVPLAVHFCTGREPGYKDFHKRMETLLVWNIDAFSRIDMEDHKWSYLILYEKDIRRTRTVYYPIGFCTLYQFYNHPYQFRSRISQFIVFPPYQNMGLGNLFLGAVNHYLCANHLIFDIVVEDPSEKFQRLRDIIDSRNCMTLSCFSEADVLQGYCSDMAFSARKAFKITEKQSHRVYEIIRLYYTTDESNEEYLKMIRSSINLRCSRPHISREYRHRHRRLPSVDDHLLGKHKSKMLEKIVQTLIAKYRLVCNKL